MGALLELGWSDIETKATQSRLMFWWRFGRTHSELMGRLESQAHQRHVNECVEERKSPYNWWRYRDKLVSNIAEQVKQTPEQMRMMPKDAFRRLINKTLWQADYKRRITTCRERSRLQLIADELSQLAAKYQRAKVQRHRWPGAPYLPFVDNKFLARLIAMPRLGVLFFF